MNFLVEERKRLGFKQSYVFESIDVSKGTYIRWEKGSPIPSDKLKALKDMGFDVAYVVTGERSVSIKRVAELIELIDSLLEEYNRKVSPSGKARLIAGLLELEQQEPEMVNKNNILPFVTAAGF